MMTPELNHSFNTKFTARSLTAQVAVAEREGLLELARSSPEFSAPTRIFGLPLTASRPTDCL